MASSLIARFPPVYQNHYTRWQRVRPTLTTRTNLSVFLYELGDIKRMFDLLPKKHIFVATKKGRVRMRNWQETLNYANNQHLNYNFGWKPFINDVRNTIKAMDTAHRRLFRFVNNAGKSETRHVSDELESDSSSEMVCPLVTAYSIKKKWTWKATQSSTFHYSYTLPKYGDGEFEWRSFLDSFGLNVNPSTIWAVIPWSFVVDWFVNIGDYLKSNETDWIQPYLQFMQACCSIDVSGTEEWFGKRNADGNWYSIGKVNVTYYRRAVGLPTFQWQTLNLDADKIRLLASLIYARM